MFEELIISKCFCQITLEMSVVSNQVEELVRLNEQLVAELADTKESLENQISLVTLREEQLCDALETNKKHEDELTKKKRVISFFKSKNSNSSLIFLSEKFIILWKNNQNNIIIYLTFV